jgi:coenzyme F420 biosynthesis associated uncharacterized protein
VWVRIVTAETEKKPDDGRLTVGRVVDWEFAANTGAWLARPGPPSTDYTQHQVIDELADASRRAELPVRDVTGLQPTTGETVPDAAIVDRPQWIKAAAESMRAMTGGDDGGPAGFLRGRLTGAQTGAVLAFISSGILGQYDPFATGGGKLLLVYPNVIAVERQLRVPPKDFRLWVCLHEVTHRVQFTANPWLVDHMSQALAVLTKDAGEDIGRVIGRLTEFVRDRREGKPPEPNSSGVLGILRLLQSEAQRTALDQLLVLGTLLEGHADHVMDAVGPAVVPSVATIRRRFDERRRHKQPPLQRLIRALLGFDAKLAQYTRGKAFVDAVVSRVGMARFNTIWSGPDALPLPAEIEEPVRWIHRVL